MKTCQFCGEDNNTDDAVKCWECGHDLVTISYTAPDTRTTEEINADLDAAATSAAANLVPVILRKLAAVGTHETAAQVKATIKQKGRTFGIALIAALTAEAAKNADLGRMLILGGKWY